MMQKVNGPAVDEALEYQFDPRTPRQRREDETLGWVLGAAFLYFAGHLLFWYVRQ